MNTAVLILSGGASSRMGQDKALLPIENTNLLTWQIQRFSDAGYPVISGLTDVFGGFNGPLAGIHAACVQCPEVDAFLVIPVDMPQLQVDTINRLIQTGERTGQSCCFQECPLPIFLPNSESLKLTLTQWLENPDGQRSVYALMKALNGVWVKPIEIENELMNINTPEQWQAFQLGAEVR
jgi:molybdopterin-guanine dinucleotide biosynthesis protein A